MRKIQILRVGKSRIAMSERMLNNAAAMKIAPRLMHSAFSINLFQDASCGLHRKILSSVMVM